MRKDKRSFHEKLLEEKEIKQNRKDLESQEMRGNRVPYFETYIWELLAGFAFFLISFGLGVFVYYKIILVYGW